MDIFFFLYYMFYGLPLGVVQLPHGVDADDVRILTAYTVLFHIALTDSSEFTTMSAPSS